MGTEPPGTGNAAGEARSLPSARIVVADDHPVIRRGVRDLLSSAASPGFNVVAEAETPAAAYEAVRRLGPELLLIDVSMPPGSGLDVLDQCLQVHPNLAAVVFSVHRDVELVKRAVALGARGYVLKDALPGELVAALRLAQRGSTYLPPGIARLLACEPAQSRPELDAREETVLRLIALGYTTAEIATEQGISERTVKNYRARVADKLGLHQRRELTRWALRHGVVGEDDYAPGGDLSRRAAHAVGGAPAEGSGHPESIRPRRAERGPSARAVRREPTHGDGRSTRSS